MAKTDIEDLAVLEKEGQRLKRKKRIFRAECRHVRTKKSKGLKATGTKGIMQCDHCKRKINFRPYSSLEETHAGEGIEKLEVAVGVVQNALEIIKYRAALDDDKPSDTVAAKAAALIIDLEGVPELMKAITAKKKDKEKQKKARKQLVDFGASALSFGGKKKKGW